MGHKAQFATCLTADKCMTADPGVASSTPAQSHNFMEIDCEIISVAILLPPLIQEGCCRLQVKVCAASTG